MSIISSRPPWGKFDAGFTHHLAHHCADVAACFEAIADIPTIRLRMEHSANRSLSTADIKRLAVLVFLHDVGKLHPGFQAKGWPEATWPGGRHGHVQEGAALFQSGAPEEVRESLCWDELDEWGVFDDGGNLLVAALAHHGRPFAVESRAKSEWQAVPGIGYDPAASAAEFGELIRSWFPEAFAAGPGVRMPTSSDFQHLFCGIVSLADWLGSTQAIFKFIPDLDHGYMERARARARRAIAEIGLDPTRYRAAGAGRTDFPTLTGGRQPRPQQVLVGEFPLDERLLILEAETGSGKTESAIWRFARLFDAGLVDSLYFALPTRAAAIQLHRRVNDAMGRLFQDRDPEAVLVVPGYIRSGEAEGSKLPDWKVRWDDDGRVDEERLVARWAAESTKRSLAAAIAVGTVDQVMLAGLQVKHAHLRAAALSRSLLVIDEVHASDHYMTEIQRHLLKMHVGRGGYAMLMSATLGSVARSRWLGQRIEPSFERAVAEPYPAVWGKEKAVPHSCDPQGEQKRVSMTLEPTMDADACARIAIEAARAGARVLIIRNTVGAAIGLFEAVRKVDEPLLLNVTGGPALHHSRFAPEDRALLDQAVETALSPATRDTAGVIVIGTQTLEQSLDIDADILLTDLCPIDVLLQRIGRLHRHKMDRPAGFRVPQCHVMMPEGGLEKLLAPAFVNGLGAIKGRGRDGVYGIYMDVPALELTRRLVVDYPEWVIPEMNRFLVESATHPDRITALNAELGRAWSTYSNTVYGKGLAERAAARGILLPIAQPFAEIRFPDDEGGSIRTRLGAEGVRVTLTKAVMGPFGVAITGFTLPAHWSRGVQTAEPVEPAMTEGAIRVDLDGVAFGYDRMGIRK